MTTPFDRASVRWATVEERDEGRWTATLLDESDDELAAVGIGVEGAWDPDVVAHVEFLLLRLGLRVFGSRPWVVDETGAHRAPVLPT
ncbi:hypothetical protein [Curtobacterium sp. RRHDQ10]|uniref:hypothetical protein n=1 Tax=Curtobacterium phyllosphaerae TaxID=3413379 RepID=UPI003BF2E28B